MTPLTNSDTTTDTGLNATDTGFNASGTGFNATDTCSGIGNSFQIPRRIILCDIDGVVCDSSERYDQFFPSKEAWLDRLAPDTLAKIAAYSRMTAGDKPLDAGVILIRCLAEAMMLDVFFLTSRNMDGYVLTLAWLR